jgi:gluconolactonase
MYQIAWVAAGWWFLCCALPVCSDERADLPPSYSVKPELYATGFEFAEGPAFDRTGNLFVVNYRGKGKIGRITPDGTASVYCDLRELAPVEGREPQANGLKVDRQGRLIVADAGGGRLLRIAQPDPDKPPVVETLADRFDGQPLNLPNDVALDLQGNVYFSDSGRLDAKGPTGAVYRYDAATGQLAQLDAGLAFSNGLAVAPDQKRLCVSESQRHRLLIYDLGPDGRATNRRVLIDFTQKPEDARIVVGRFEPDGMIFDSFGRLYVAMFTSSGGMINVVEVPSGKLLRQYDAGGAKSTNCHFHDGCLYTTTAAKEAVFRLKLGVEGFDYRRKP